LNSPLRPISLQYQSDCALVQAKPLIPLYPFTARDILML
jgi:hypothetical protein